MNHHAAMVCSRYSAIPVDRWSYIIGTGWRLSDALAGLWVMCSGAEDASGHAHSHHLGTHLHVPV